MLEDLILAGVAMIVTYLVGLIQNKPGYKKGKNLLKVTNKAAEDDKITTAEAKEIYQAIKKFL